MNFFELMNQIGEMRKTGEIKETSNPKDNDLSIFHFVPDGKIYAANKSKPSKATIIIPRDVCGESVSDLFDWEIKVIAIKRDKLKMAIDEFKKADEIKKDEQEI